MSAEPRLCRDTFICMLPSQGTVILSARLLRAKDLNHSATSTRPDLQNRKFIFSGACP
jgi:hypothetical protein